MDCCASTQGPELGLALRFLKSLAAVVYRAVTLPYAESVGSLVFILTFLWVLVFQRGTPISTGEHAAVETTRHAA